VLLFGAPGIARLILQCQRQGQTPGADDTRENRQRPDHWMRLGAIQKALQIQIDVNELQYIT
jgi:hypothetical protein